MDETSSHQHSSIPQFLLDTQHPWIIEHQQTLDLLPDVESFLCSPLGTKSTSRPAPVKPLDSSTESESKTQDGASTITVPADLFHSLNINNNCGHISRPGWPNVRDRLHEMQRCPPAALARVRSLHVEQQGPTDELLDLFESVLAAMTGLEKLRWAILPDFAQGIKDGFAARGLRLPSVTRLEPAPFCEYMVDACPNTEVLEGANGLSWTGKKGEEMYGSLLVEAAAAAPKVKVFAGTASLTPSFISVLAEFSYLEQLGLPAAANLGYAGVEHKCGNPFLGGAKAAELGYRTTRQEYEGTEKVASVVVEMLPRLRHLTIDGREATITHDENGKASASWPWSGRLDEYLDEILLRPKS
ncbi:hypothetical protein DL765_009344 [Monosporascus sp. GIB2]|nr:hypothetical protein DL765_009344 [Monosporascus sp. GIB2]